MACSRSPSLYRKQDRNPGLLILGQKCLLCAGLPPLVALLRDTKSPLHRRCFFSRCFGSSSKTSFIFWGEDELRRPLPPECEGKKSWTGPQRKKGWAVWLVRITDIGLEYHCSAAVVFKRSLVLLTVELLWRNRGGGMGGGSRFLVP